ncbi:MAG: DUF3810 family protein, partial [Candidatus Eremiobacteraeota bacterium]|nr:DUF3810 family protein [Candidatus Eremiobacteraeota bacterium]
MNRGTPVVLFQTLVVAAAIVVFAIHPGAGWVEAQFINGYYPVLETTLGSVSGSVPFPVGDWLMLAGIVLVLVRAVVWWRRTGPRRGRFTRYVLETACVCALYGVAFYAAWGWCYDRAPLVERVNFDQSRVTASSVAMLRGQAIQHVNDLAPLAHRSNRTTQFDPLKIDVARIVE